MTHPVLVRPECVAIAGDLVTGTLLSQIVYWNLPSKTGQSKLRIQRHGVYWIAKTREQWMEETGLTLDQYRRAIGVLKRKHLVEVRVMRFKGLAQSHLRLLQPVASLTSERGDPSPGKGMIPHPDRSTYSICSKSTASRLGEQRTFARTNNDQDIEEEGRDPTGRERDPTRESNDQKSSERTGRARSETQQVVSQNHTGGSGVFMKAEEVLKALQAPTNGSLGAYWKSRCALVTGEWQRTLTSKEQGQLKQLQKYLGDQTKPIIDYAVNHWVKFAQRAGAAAGTSFPVDPHIGFLLKHHAVAVNLLRPQLGKTLPPVPVEDVVQPIASTREDQPVHTLTPQELTELLDGLKSP